MYPRLNRLLLVVVFLFPAACLGDIQVQPTYEEHAPIVATVTITDVPEGAKLRGSFAVSDGKWEKVSVPNSAALGKAASDARDALSHIPVEYQPKIQALITEAEKAVAGDTYHVWAAPGKHVLTAQGVWVLTKDVTVGDQTFPVLIDFGQFRYEKTITVTGGGPDPPPPPPPPPGARVAVILEETSQRTPAQAILWDQLRKLYPVGKLEIVDDDRPESQKYVQMCELTARPVLLVLTDKGQLVREVACPATVAEVQREVNR